MTRLLLDRSAYIAFKKRHPEVLEILPQAEEIWLSPIVLGELRAGFLQGSKRESNERELRMFLESLRVSVLITGFPSSPQTAIFRTFPRSLFATFSPSSTLLPLVFSCPLLCPHVSFQLS